MSRKDLIEIFKQIVKDMEYDPQLQINTFAVIEDGIDFRLTSFGKSYEDYLNGNFWSRSWANAGAPSDAIKGEYPLLFIEQKSLTIDCLDSPSMSLPFYVVVADKHTCDNCPEGFVRTLDDVSSNTLVLLRMVFKELLNYRLYEYTIGAETLFSWSTQGRMDHLLSEGEIDSIVNWSEDFRGVVDESQPIRVAQWGNFENIRAHSSTLTIRVCDEVSGSFDYTKTKSEDLARTKCDSC